ncbi:MAG: M48 family metallopeptidase [Balneolaceae bacterium]|nr:M48 family metallopeptidase [Balneolaceae bacterium]
MFRKKRKKYDLEISGIGIEVRRKNVKNLNIQVYPAEKKVKISAPMQASDRAIQQFAQSRMSWIQKHFKNYEERPQEQVKEYKTGETHWLWGKGHELDIHIASAKPKVVIETEQAKLHLYVRPGSSTAKKAKVLKEWYRAQLKQEIPKLIEKWEPEMGVSVKEFGVKQMKTRWGTCNTRARRIWLNLELATKPREALEYVVVHEMVHLLERLHNKRFYALMEHYLPDWKERDSFLKEHRID